MMDKTRFIALAMVVLVAGGAHTAAQAAPIGDPVAGEEKAGLCGGCHGFDGNSEDAGFPRLAGQYAGYIFKQIKDFQKGHRTNNDTMAGMAAMVASEQDAKDIGVYFAQKKMAAKPLVKPNKQLVAQGKKLFVQGDAKKGIYGCINCHGERGKGKSASVSVFPVIGGQHRDYLIKQLKEFRTGARGNDPAGMMSAVAANMSDKEIEAVAEYLATQL